jgi:hypothetical protein
MWEGVHSHDIRSQNLSPIRVELCSDTLLYYKFRLAEGSVEIFSKPLKNPVPPINRRLLPITRTIHRKEAVSGIIIHMELIGLSPFFEFLFSSRHMFRRRTLVFSAKETKQRTAQVLCIVDWSYGLTCGKFLRGGHNTATIAINRGVYSAKRACGQVDLPASGTIANDANLAVEIRQGTLALFPSGEPLPSRKWRFGEMAT